MRLHMVVQRGQFVKRHLRQCVVFNVIGHVPRQKPDDAVGIGGAGVFQHVGNKGAAAMFGAAGFVQGSGLVMLAAATLAGLRAFDPAKWKRLFARLPFMKKSVPLLEDEAGRSMPSAEVIKKVALAFSVTTDELIFDKHERAPDQNLQLAFEAVSNMGEEDQQTIMSLIEGMILKHQAKTLFGARKAS